MRKTQIVTIAEEGRDYGKRFLITEMPAYQAEKWAQRALLALAHSGVDLGEAVIQGGIAGLALAGLRALESLSFDEAEPLLDEMIGCVRIIPDPKNLEFSRALILRSPAVEATGTEPGRPEGASDDVQEVITFWRLREAVFGLHTDFFKNGMPWRSTSGTTTETTSPAQSSGRTSRARSRAR